MSAPDTPSCSTPAGESLLLHVCCGPCATATIDYWRGEGLVVSGFYYNPNIQPLLEHRRRLEGVRILAEARTLPLTEDNAYDPVEWFRLVGLREKNRCGACIALRMERAARQAAELGVGSFATTLAISPWQDHDAIRSGGREAAEQYGLTFVYEDLRRLFGESRRQARDLNLYRQQYCGCIISEWERYRDR